MINDLESNTLSRSTLVRPAAARVRGRKKLSPTARGTTFVPVSAPFAGLAEPAFSSLWDLGLLDRLKAPLTRYHE